MPELERSSASRREQLSRLGELLQEKHEKCSAGLKAVEEQNDVKKRYRERKDAERERLRQQLAQIVSEQEAERNQHNEANVAGQGPISCFVELRLDDKLYIYMNE